MSVPAHRPHDRPLSLCLTFDLSGDLRERPQGGGILGSLSEIPREVKGKAFVYKAKRLSLRGFLTDSGTYGSHSKVSEHWSTVI